MAGLIRAYDWAATPLGPIESWRDRLRSVVEMMLIDPRPSSLAVGEARTFLFNDAAARLYGSCAPGLLGQPLPKATLERFRERFRPRLDALARINGLLSRLEEGDRITFDQLLEEELAAHGVLNGESNGTAVHLHGPRGIRLRSATVQTFALALHELTTNALKYGALSQPEGRLDVTWCLIPGNGTERRLRVDWREIGVVVDRPDGTETNHDAPPRRHGYGRELIERALPYQLKAETTYELTPKGVRCTVIVPVSSTLEVAFSSQEDPDA